MASSGEVQMFRQSTMNKSSKHSRTLSDGAKQEVALKSNLQSSTQRKSISSNTSIMEEDISSRM